MRFRKTITIDPELNFIVEKYCESSGNNFSLFIYTLMLDFFQQRKNVSGTVKKSIQNIARRGELKNKMNIRKILNQEAYWGINAKLRIINYARNCYAAFSEVNMEIVDYLIANDLAVYEKLDKDMKIMLLEDKFSLEKLRDRGELCNALSSCINFNNIEKAEKHEYARALPYRKSTGKSSSL